MRNIIWVFPTLILWSSTNTEIAKLPVSQIRHQWRHLKLPCSQQLRQVVTMTFCTFQCRGTTVLSKICIIDHAVPFCLSCLFEFYIHSVQFLALIYQFILLLVNNPQWILKTNTNKATMIVRNFINSNTLLWSLFLKHKSSNMKYAIHNQNTIRRSAKLPATSPLKRPILSLPSSVKSFWRVVRGAGANRWKLHRMARCRQETWGGRGQRNHGVVLHECKCIPWWYNDTFQHYWSFVGESASHWWIPFIKVQWFLCC